MKGEETQMTKQGLVLVFNLVFGVFTDHATSG